MTTLSEQLQSADWKKEKHVPVIDCPDSVRAGEYFDVRISVGREIAHPNTTDHHIRWISLFFKPDGEKFTHQVGAFSFDAHGESVDGPDKGAVYTDHSVTARLKIAGAGMLFASSLCNIHGLWQSGRAVAVD
ncbi:MAG: class II SORL domain-containing protein [Thermodesulfobacteriota bacterium]